MFINNMGHLTTRSTLLSQLFAYLCLVAVCRVFVPSGRTRWAWRRIHEQCPHTQVLPAAGPYVILLLHWVALKLHAEMMGGRSLSAVTVLMLLAVCPLPQSDGILRCPPLLRPAGVIDDLQVETVVSVTGLVVSSYG